MYDPVVGRVLSPDNFVQNAYSTQDYNRYTYGKNNPLVCTDPDGEWIHIVIGAALGGVINLGIKAFQGKIHNFKDGAVAFGIGAAAGAITAATGGAATSALGLSAASFAGGAVAGAAGAATGGLVQGLGNAAYFHDSYSFKEWAIGIGIGTVTGGVIGGIVAPKGKFWMGSRFSGSGGALTFVDAELPDGSVVKSFAGVNSGDAVAYGTKANSIGVELVDDITVQFGKNPNQISHAFRHTDELGLSRPMVQSSIQSHFKSVYSQVVVGKPFNQIIEIGGQKIQYTAFKLPNGVFNIGRIHGIP